MFLYFMLMLCSIRETISADIFLLVSSLFRDLALFKGVQYLRNPLFIDPLYVCHRSVGREASKTRIASIRKVPMTDDGWDRAFADMIQFVCLGMVVTSYLTEMDEQQKAKKVRILPMSIVFDRLQSILVVAYDSWDGAVRSSLEVGEDMPASRLGMDFSTRCEFRLVWLVF